MSFLENCIIPFLYQYPVSQFFLVMKQELLPPLRVLHVYFYSVSFQHRNHNQSYGYGSLPAQTLSENKGMNCE